MYLLDTNIISEIRKIGSGKANEGVYNWATRMHKDDLFISVITVLEIQKGCLQLKRHDPEQAHRYERWLHNDVIPSFTHRILDINTDIALCCASLHIPDQRPVNDALIAATAFIHGLTLVTRNTKDFHNMPVKLFNPFT